MRKKKIKELRIRLKFLTDIDDEFLGVFLYPKEYKKMLDHIKQLRLYIKELEDECKDYKSR